MFSSKEIKEKYINFFKSKGHKHLPSSSLVPHNDPTVLLTTAGMLQFKPIMFGVEQPNETRVTTYQKCCRTTDLDNVGRTPRHHTFFEMLGNFSFGDYYKREIISWSWDFITNDLKIPVSKLSVTVHHKDQEAYDIWHKEMGLSEDKIVKLGDEDNFWAAGETGPCGFCSEIYYDMGEEHGNGDPNEKAGSSSNRFLEFWNLVFMEFNKKEDGSLAPLPSKNIDTGMGLERITAILQGVETNFDTDVFRDLLNKIEEISGKKYRSSKEDDVYFKIIADHIRASVYLIADGVIPGNIGREYVLRRIIRRAIRYGKLLGIEKPFLNELIPNVIDYGKDYYKELEEKRESINKTIQKEEELFNRTLNNGMKILNKNISQLKEENNNELSGKVAFELYDTYGFPFELTYEIAQENNLSVNKEEYDSEMEKQVKRAKEAHHVHTLNDVAVQLDLEDIPATIFTGYYESRTISKVLAANFDSEKNTIVFVLDKTCAYAESGGQVSDRGEVEINNKVFELTNVQKVGDYFLHVINSNEDILKVGDTVNVSIEYEIRKATARHHSVTHLLHQALKDVLGLHVKQAGSLVNENFTRFDFNHNAPMTKDEIRKVEEIVNKKVLDNLSVKAEVMDIEDAKKSGAVAMFGEKYGKKVRVLSMGEYSKEFCGGTHVNRTGDIGLFKIVSEEAIAAGVRRITGVSGLEFYKNSKKEEEIVQDLSVRFKVPKEEVLQRVDKLQDELKLKEKEINQLKEKFALMQSKDLINNAKELNEIKYIAEKTDISDNKALKNISDDLLSKLGTGVILLIAVSEDNKIYIVCSVSKDLTNKGLNAGNIIKSISPILGAKGGGKADFAQAGGGNEINNISLAITEFENYIKEEKYAKR